MLVRSQAWLLRLLDRLIPAASLSDPIQLRQGRLLVGILVLLGVPMPGFLLSQILHAQWGLIPFTVFTTILVSGLLVFFRRTGRRALSTQIMLVFGSVAILGSAWQTGGIYAPALINLTLTPMLAFVLISPRWGYVWLMIAILGFGGFLGVELLGIPLHSPESAQLRPTDIMLNLMSFTLYASGCVVFQNGVNALQRQQVEQSRERAEAASATKSIFLANMSHELRTPLNGVLGLSEAMMLEGALSREQTETLQTILRSGRSLSLLLDDLLDFSKLEAARVTLESLPLDPAELLHGVAELLRERIAAQQIRLHEEIAPDLGWGLGDPTRLQQILLNLLGNAIKFTPHGDIRLTLRREGDDIRISVADTGVGIAAETLPHLFEPFVQADLSTTRRFGGSGLGLAISRRLARLMAGDITVQSQLRQGSTFTLRVPFPPCAAPVGSHPLDMERLSMGHLSVLVAEDNAINQMVIRRLLRQLGVVPLVVPDGAAALEALAAHRPDVILMDVHMPVMDGLDATRAIRAQGLTVPILALTASALSEDREAAQQAGMDGFLPKPLRLEDLQGALAPYARATA